MEKILLYAARRDREGALLTAYYVASEIILPVAFFLMLVLQPVVRLFEKLHLPRAIRFPRNFASGRVPTVATTRRWPSRRGSPRSLVLDLGIQLAA